MEMELYTDVLPEGDNFHIGVDNDDNAFDGERCGICMDIVIDRGVLDCCQHWFCFGCIDNWSTITNLCPLCQNEFQLITCVPVYDTTGSNKVDEDSFSRDDDWSLEGKNNTLSFPSYYIDENAVKCLNGDGCKIRSGLATTEDDPDFDTSIACDSCDTWYHAFCVGFDTEDTSESTWLCPSCDIDKPSQTADVASMLNNQLDRNNATSEIFTEATLTRKVSVSIADAGETAVVVSMVGENHRTEELSEELLSNVDMDKDTEIGASVANSNENCPKGQTSSTTRANIQQNSERQGPELSLSCNPSCTLPSSSTTNMKTESGDKKLSERDGPDEFRISSGKLLGESCIKNELIESESNTSLHLGLPLGTIVSDQVDLGVQKNKPSEESILSVNNIIPAADEGAVGITGLRRKHRDCSSDDNEVKADSGTDVSAKRPRVRENIEMVTSEKQVYESASDNSKNSPILLAESKDEKLRHNVERDRASDIMSIVKGTDHRPLKRLVRSNPVNKSEGENTSGLRVKKIVRRPPQDNDSAMLVQNLRQEIREAVRNKSMKDAGKELFDPKLLAAFRAAVSGPIVDPAMKSSPLAVKTKKSMLQKGKVRESLTRKIYATSNGRRKRAWDREYEIEFWKHRCMRSSKPEKIETLKSVLDLLRKKSGNAETEHHSQLQDRNPVLSRLYLADTSVFPKKDDAEPISALKDADKSDHNIGSVSSIVTSFKPFQRNHIGNKGSLNGILSSKGVSTYSSTKHPDRLSKGPSGSLSGGSSILNKQKEKYVKPDDIKSDKKKWALEVLARKTAVAGKNGSSEKQEDTALLKGNYPLLAQLPVEMRPVLAPSRHYKIPISVRQTQLYRLTEHFLKMTHLPVILRTADTELAVADAINIEKEIADRSNSKLVYVNLCSQELLRRSDNANSSKALDSYPPPSSTISADVSEQATNELSRDPEIQEALRNAGLLSDSSPDSPYDDLNGLPDENGPSVMTEEEGLANIFEMDTCPELDIYGDFEYDLEDEDYIGADAISLSKLQPEGESRVKVVFSTLTSDRSANVLGNEDCESMQFDVPPCLLKGQTDADLPNSAVEGGVDKSCHPPECIQVEGEEEPSLTECEELYGPDKELLIVRFPEVACRKLEPVCAETLGTVQGNSNNNVSNQGVRGTGLESAPCAQNLSEATVAHNSSGGENSPQLNKIDDKVHGKKMKNTTDTNKQSDNSISVSKKVEAYIKEHIRPLCKSGVISAEQYRWAVAKTTEKVMKYHSKDKNASFLIKEGEKVKKLAEQYLETAPQK